MEKYTPQQLDEMFRKGNAVEGNYSDITSISEHDAETKIRQQVPVNPIYIESDNITIWQKTEAFNTVQILKTPDGGSVKIREPRSLNGQ